MPSSPIPAEDEGECLTLRHKPARNCVFDSPAVSPTTESPEAVMLCSSPPPAVTARPVKVSPKAAPEAPKKPSYEYDLIISIKSIKTNAHTDARSHPR